MFQRSKTGRAGQTLLEALIALSVVTMGFLGLVSLLSKSFFYDRVTSDQLTATYLASEGVELAKNLIDHNAWGTCFVSGDFQLDYTTENCNTIQNYNGNVILQFDPTADRYSYHSTPNSLATAFARRIRVTVQGDEIAVQSIVTWSTGPITSQSVNLEDHFYNWRQ